MVLWLKSGCKRDVWCVHLRCYKPGCTHDVRCIHLRCPLIHGYWTNSFLCHKSLIASTRLLLTTWLNSWESISKPANFAHLLILPFSVFPLYAHTRFVKGHFLMLCRQSGTLFLTISGHPTPCHPSNHYLKLIFFSSPTDCVCLGGGKREREWGRERGKSEGGEREN